MNADLGELSCVFVSDLSEHGVFVHADQRVPLGTELDLHFTVVLEDPVVLRGRGRVVRHQEAPRGMGIEFTDLAPEMILRINDVVLRERPQELGPPIVQDDAKADVEAEAAQTHPRISSDAIRAAQRRGSRLPGDDTDESDDAATLRNLKSVGASIVEENDLPQDDGSDLFPPPKNQP